MRRVFVTKMKLVPGINKSFPSMLVPHVWYVVVFLYFTYIELNFQCQITSRSLHHHKSEVLNENFILFCCLVSRPMKCAYSKTSAPHLLYISSRWSPQYFLLFPMFYVLLLFLFILCYFNIISHWLPPRLLTLYIYHASCNARNAKVIYISRWHIHHFGNAVSPFIYFLCNVSTLNQFWERFSSLLGCKKL